MDELTRKKISIALRGRTRSATTVKRISQKLKGRKLSEKHKQHIREAMKRKYQQQQKKVECRTSTLSLVKSVHFLPNGKQDNNYENKICLHSIKSK